MLKIHQINEQKPEGSVHIENIPDTPDKKIEMGDYVNYEEIDWKINKPAHEKFWFLKNLSLM